ARVVCRPRGGVRDAGGPGRPRGADGVGGRGPQSPRGHQLAGAGRARARGIPAPPAVSRRPGPSPDRGDAARRLWAPSWLRTAARGLQAETRAALARTYAFQATDRARYRLSSHGRELGARARPTEFSHRPLPRGLP